MKTTPITQIMFDGQSFPIPASDGTRIIAVGKNIAWLDPDFQKFKLNEPSRPTKATNVVIREVIANGTFWQIFKDINPDWRQSIMTMSQIGEFLERYPDKLRQDGLGTFFLTEKRLNILQKLCRFLFNKQMGYFVVRVCVRSGSLRVYVYRLGNDLVCYGECRLRVVSPQLIPLAE